MNNLSDFRHLLDPPYFRVCFAVITAFLICFFTIPSIIRLSKQKGLLYMPNERSSHEVPVPRLGGIGIFLAIMVATLVFMQVSDLQSIQFVIAGMVVIFILGLRDDLNSLSPWVKLVAEVIACLLVIIPGHVYFTNIFGFLGFTLIYQWVGIPLTLFVMIVLINSFNLVDGIDGLAGGVGITIFVTFGAFFFYNGHYSDAILAAGGTGALIAFLWYNVFSKKNKIFMGDGGALMLGFIFSYFVIHFNELNAANHIPYRMVSAPAVAMGIMALPLFDTLRVFFIRTLRRQSPFHADKQHIHHILLGLGMTHGQAALALVGFNLICITIAFGLDKYTNSVLKLMLILFMFNMIAIEVLNQLMFYKKGKG
jgi:UDP-GlcNAc:undecaprenyl-phosphate/decaprenyl-phosphate GlcNAc-1-phosphate transferase